MPHPNRQKCDYNNPPAPGKVCDFSLDDLGPCNDENSYGYSKKTPCVLLKLKKNPSWLPEFMNETDLPLEMPKDLQKHILEVSNNLVAWLSCVGENPSSEENIGLIKYLPQRGFRANQISASKDALDPFVAVYFQLPTKGILIDVKCTLWTKDSADAVTFKLMVD